METVNQGQDTAQQPERTFTQSELDAIISDRLKREREKYVDYDDLKAKADKYDQAEEAAKSDLQKATERADALQSQLDSLLKADSLRKIREKSGGGLSGCQRRKRTEKALAGKNDRPEFGRTAEFILKLAQKTQMAIMESGNSAGDRTS